MMDKIKIIGKKVKFFRNQKGISQKQLCEVLGITDKTLQKIEKTGNLTSEVLFKIAEYFNKNPIIFLSENSAKYVKESDVPYVSQKDSEIELVKAERKFLQLKVESLERKDQLREEQINGLKNYLIRLGVEDSIIVQIMEYVNKIKQYPN